MADFSALKTAILNYIKQNGNEEITGEILQTILLSIVTTLGDSAIDDLITALNNEVAARQNTDSSLEGAINQEGTLRSNADSTLQGNINAEATARQNADAALQAAIDLINSYIPAQASSSNKLADRDFVNSSIATATATFRGSYNVVTDLELSYNATHAQIQAALATKMSALSITPDNNDYAFVQIPTANATPTQIAKTEKYKFNGSAWAFEYVLNNSGFTAAQWAAINSGATLELIGKLSALPTNAELTELLAAKQNVIQDLATIRSGATAGATAVQPATLNTALSDTVAESGVYDVTANNDNAKFASLSALLSSENLDTLIPTAKRKGGMSIKYVQSSDNNYVQFRFMLSGSFTTAQFTNPDNWQGVDDEPTAGSNNLVKSGGVYDAIKNRDTISRYTQFPIQNVSKKLSFSDNTFGNLSKSFAVSVFFKKNSAAVLNVGEVVFIGKGDYTTNGWGIIQKVQSAADTKIYFVLNGTYYELIKETSNSNLIYKLIVINNTDAVDVYFCNQKLVSIAKSGVVDNDAYLQIGGNDTSAYSFVQCQLAAFWYNAPTIETCLKDIEKITSGAFSRIELSADFVCCESTLVSKGFKDGKYSLLGTNNISISYVTIPASNKGVNITNSFGEFTLHGFTSYAESFFDNSFAFTSKLIDVSNYKKAIIHKAATQRFSKNTARARFWDKNNIEIKRYLSGIMTADGIDGSYSYKNIVSVEIPSEAKYSQFSIWYDGYVEFEDKDADYITPAIIDIPKYKNNNFLKTPCIIFEASDYISGAYITRAGLWEEHNGIEVIASSNNDKTIQISTDYLSYFTNMYMYNLVYETPNGDQDIMYVYRDSDDGILHILSDIVPPVGTMLYSHIHIRKDGSEQAGEMHLSTLAYRVMGHKIVEDSNNIFNALISNKCGFSGYVLDNISSVPNFQDDFGVLYDMNGNPCWNYRGNRFAIWSNIFTPRGSTWGMTESSLCFYTSNNHSTVFKQKASFKKGVYEIKAVAPRTYINGSGTRVQNSPIVLNVYNNDKLIHTQTLCDYHAKNVLVSLYGEHSGNQIYNLNKEVQDKAYVNTNQIISAVPQNKRELGIIVTARTSNGNGLDKEKYNTLIFVGDSLDNFTDEKCWLQYDFDNVKIEFTSSGTDALLTMYRLMQYDYKDNYYNMGINSSSYIAYLGDSWGLSADAETTYEEGIKQYNYEMIPPGGNPVIVYDSRPLLRGILETGCSLDSWTMGTKTAAWAWQYQIRHLIKHTEYSHCIIEYFTNDSDSDWYGCMPALVKICQENGIVPVVFAPISGRERQTGYLKAVL